MITRFLEKTQYNGVLEFLVADSSVGERGKDVRDWINNHKPIIPLYDKVVTGRCHKFNMITEASRGKYIVEFEDDIYIGKHVNEDWLNIAIKELESNHSKTFYSLCFPEIPMPILSGFIMSLEFRKNSKRLDSVQNGKFLNVVHETEKCAKTFSKGFYIDPDTRKSPRKDIKLIGADIIRVNPSHPSVNFSEYMRTKVGYINRRGRQTPKFMKKMQKLAEENIYWHGPYQGDKEYQEMKISEWEKPRWDAHHESIDSVILGKKDKDK